MKVVVLWTHLSGYLNSCLKALAAIEGVKLLVVNIMTAEEVPFDESLFSWIENHYQWKTDVNSAELLSRIESFRPELILASGWRIPEYRFVMKKFKGRAVRIVSTDQPWQARPKQLIGVLISKFYIHPICDAVFVSGERQASYAKKLGFQQSQIWRGVLSCDHDKFSAVNLEREQFKIDACSFAFIGRFSPEKGLDVLVAAYRAYRAIAVNPWPLKCYGAGPLQHLIDGIEGIENKGFCQPDSLPGELLTSSCLVLPSIYEPWALVVHEAASAGMAIICTDVVGSSVHLVQDGYNGYIVGVRDAFELAQAMLRYSSLSQKARNLMGENSYRMSLQFTPNRWASTLVGNALELMTSKGVWR